MNLNEQETSGDGHRIPMEVTTDMEDIQGEGGGGFLRSNAYFNPALSVSSQSICNGKMCKECDDCGGTREPYLSAPNTAGSECSEYLKTKWQKFCRKKTLKKRLPIMTWLPRYTTEDFAGDLVAGITVGLTVIPQSLAYANIAHVPLQHGLYSSFLGCIIYIFIGSCKDVPFGPTAIVSLLTYDAIGDRGIEHAILLSFMSGVIQLLMGLCGFGFLIDFVSGPVASGFTSAVALIILTSQVKDLLGIPASGNVFIHTWSNIFQNIHQTNIWDAVLGIFSIAFLLTLRLGSKIPVSSVAGNGTRRTIFQTWRNRILWTIATSRNAILILICACTGYYFFTQGHVPFTLIGHVPQGMPKVQVPPFQYEKTEGNSTITVTFSDMVSNLGSSIIMVPLLALLENIAVCKAFAHGKTVDSTQEFLAIGICNIANSFMQSMPASGSVSRSAVQHFSGARTPLCGLYTGTLVILALIFFTPCFYFIPKAALASVLIAAVIFMVEIKVVKPMWRTKKIDLALGVGTFILCLVLPLDKGVCLGVVINLVFILHQAARPKMTVEKLKSKNGIGYLMLTPDRCLIFPGVEYIRKLVTKYSIKENLAIVMDCSFIYCADYTAACVIQALTSDFSSKNQPLIFYNLKPSVCAVFEAMCVTNFKVVYDQETLQEVIEQTSSVIK